MPMFLYQCLSCQHEFEEFLPSYKSANPPCAKCAAETKRLIAAAVAHSLKGAGWSQDLYSTTNKGEQARSDRADKKDRVVSFPGQLHKGRNNA